MELSRQTDYAVRAMVDLAGFPAGTRVSTLEIAKREDIPASLLPRIVAALSKAQLIETYRGKDGGIALARRADRISLMDVIQAIEGPLCLNRCTSQPSRCYRASFCRVHPVWMQAQTYLDRLLGKTTLASLAQSSPS